MEVREQDIIQYESRLMLELDKLGATKEEKALVQTPTIVNAIKQNREPKDVAWALLQ